MTDLEQALARLAPTPPPPGLDRAIADAGLEARLRQLTPRAPSADLDRRIVRSARRVRLRRVGVAGLLLAAGVIIAFTLHAQHQDDAPAASTRLGAPTAISNLRLSQTVLGWQDETDRSDEGLRVLRVRDLEWEDPASQTRFRVSIPEYAGVTPVRCAY